MRCLKERLELRRRNNKGLGNIALWVALQCVACSSTNITRQIKEDEIGGKRMVEVRNTYVLQLETLKGKRPLGRQRPRWEDDIKIDLQWVQDRVQWQVLVKTKTDLRVS
jgi:hypothetical protein